MKNSLFKKIIAVSLALSTLMFAGCSKDKPVSEESPSESITQNVDESTTQEAEGTDKEETSEQPAEDEDDEYSVELDIMKETIDLKKVDLTKYGLSKNNDISVPYPTSLGCVYVVRDYGKEEEKTYLFATTKDKVMYLDTEFPSAGGIPVEKAHSLTTGDLDGKKGEEIVLLANTGGNGGAGIYCSSIYKIDNGKIVEMKMSDEAPFEVTLEAPYTVVFKNKKLKFEEKIVCDSDYEGLFDDKGNPVAKEYDGGFYAPHEGEAVCFEGEKSYVNFTSYSYLSRSMNNKEVYSSVDYVYDSKTNQFVVSDVSVWASEVEDDSQDYEDLSYSNGYTYCDINKDGVDELITHTGTCEADRAYHIYTFADGKMIYAGSFGGWHGSLWAKDKAITVVSTGASLDGTVIITTTYELVNNKLVEKNVFEKEFTDYADVEKYFDDFNKSHKELAINNIYYK